jgi:endoglucanase
VLGACDPGSTAGGLPPNQEPSAPSVCSKFELRTADGCVALPTIKVDTVGYLVERAKLATLPAVEVNRFEVVDTETDESVFEGELSVSTDNTDTGDTTQVAEFSELKTPGTYVVRVEGLADSPPFVIRSDAWNEPLRVVMLGLYGQRCGVDVQFDYQGTTFKHRACHLNDGLSGGKFEGGVWTDDGDERDGTGGWHDAGDYGKYTVNGAFALAFLFKAWEDFGDKLGHVEHVPDYSDKLPQWLAEAKFQMDQLLKMQLEDGSASHMLGPQAYPNTVMPEADTPIRRFTDASSAATADLVAVAAMASRVFRELDGEFADKCLAAAERGQAFLDVNTVAVSPSFSGFTHIAYSGNPDSDERFWALVELWRTNGDTALLKRVEDALPKSVSINFDWANVQNLGVFSYVQAQSDARDAAKLEAAKQAIIASADTLVANTSAHAYGRGIGSMYYWGVNGVLARSTMNLLIANQIEPDASYLDAAAQQLDHLFGRNPFGRTMVTGLGYLPARNPHHRPSQSDGIEEPWPGLLVGGPNPDDPVAAKQAPGLAWTDYAGDYFVNEVAINWNTALAYALAGFYE